MKLRVVMEADGISGVATVAEPCCDAVTAGPNLLPCRFGVVLRPVFDGLAGLSRFHVPFGGNELPLCHCPSCGAPVRLISVELAARVAQSGESRAYGTLQTGGTL